MEEALWRSNHGFDPVINEHYTWNGTRALEDSQMRYDCIAGMLQTWMGKRAVPL